MGPTEPTCLRPIVIRARRPSLWADLAEIWQFRELLLTLVARELRLRYAQTWVGIAWVVLKPVVTMALLYAIFGVAADLPTDGLPGPVFFFAGLMLWFFFSGAITDSKDSLVANADLIRKVYFPRPLLPLAIVIARLIDLGIMLVCLAVMLLVLGEARWPSLLGLLWVITTISLLAAAVGFVAAAVNVRYRDATHVVPVALQLLMFASPIVYSSRLVPADWSAVYALNPLVGLIDGFRAALMGLPADPRSASVAVAITCALLVASTLTFRRLEASFADHV
ncbi:MAG: ABC transporter permease [Vicinamibacterales bacterium]